MTLSKKPLHLYSAADMITSIIKAHCSSDNCKFNLKGSLHLLQLTLNTHNTVIMPEQERSKTYSMMRNSKPTIYATLNIQGNPASQNCYCVVLIVKYVTRKKTIIVLQL